MPKRLELVERRASDRGAEAMTQLRALVLAAVPELAELLASAGPDGQLVDVLNMLPPSERKPGGDGRHRIGVARAAVTACRSGAIAGAAMVGRRYVAPRSSVLAWLRAQGPRPLPAPVDKAGMGDELEDLRRSLARPERPRTKRRAG